jgi:hypothetical protein
LIRIPYWNDVSLKVNHDWECQISAAYAVSAEHCGLLRLWECRNNGASRMWIYAKHDVERTNSWTNHFEQKDQSYGEWEWHGRVRLDLGSTYSVAINRTNRYCRLQVSAPESLEESLEDSGNSRCADTPYHEVWLCSTLRTPHRNATMEPASIHCNQ